ncbi:GDSL-type esterase/lipase family protein [Eubacterium sp.]|uniref:SGNH/GDSL hydrolase family protein n=1 Tax=Eubacterium sp. TaxID=142586 RepID=UPI0025DE6C75|nr:GDSL-type esterase/lipase family protein [Eubacterium sp.]MCR5629566.1 hypothetical protein [Eubacterium sp.]
MLKNNKTNSNKSKLSYALLPLLVVLVMVGTFSIAKPYVTGANEKSANDNSTEKNIEGVTTATDGNSTETEKLAKEEPLNLNLAVTMRLFRDDVAKVKIKNLKYASKIEVSSSNKNVATIKKDGTIQAKHCGKADLSMKLTYKNSEKNLTFKTIVRKCSYRNKKGFIIYSDESNKITATSTTKDASITVESSNKKVAEIKDGKIVAKKTGKALISATVKKESEESKIVFAVSVKKKPELKITEKLIDDWFNGSIIAGHSIGCGFQMYCNMQYKGYLGTARHLCKNCYGVYNDNKAVTSSSLHYTVNGKKAKLKDHVKALKAKKVFINYGLNDIGEGGAPRFINAYEPFLTELCRKNPKTTVYIISPTPIYDERGGLNNSNMREINKALKKYAKENKRVEFIDMYTPLIDSNGKLRADLCSDHYCHLTFGGYKIYGDTLRAYAKESLTKDTDKEDREFTKKEVKKYKLTK